MSKLVHGQVTPEHASQQGQETATNPRDRGTGPRDAADVPARAVQGQVTADGPQGQAIDERPYPQHRPYPKYWADAGEPNGPSTGLGGLLGRPESGPPTRGTVVGGRGPDSAGAPAIGAK